MNHFMKLSALLGLLVPLAAFASEGGGTSEAKLPPAATPAPDNINTYLHLQVNNLTKAQAPQVVDRAVLFTWKGDSQPRYVAVAFEHEAYREKHVFWRNQNGVYFLVMDLTSETPTTLNYRLIVDGLWQADPANPVQIRNSQGVRLSQVSLSTASLPAHHGPVQGYYGEVEFAYHAAPGLQIAIVGDFNQWDPFANFLEESHPGEYHIKLTLPPGTVLYKFVVGTKSVLDPGNAHTGHDAQGGTFSYFENRLTTPVKVLDAKLAVAPSAH